MPVIIDASETHKPGSQFLIASAADDGGAAVAFEDDGDTGYFYACVKINGPILDAVHIYDAARVVDSDVPSEFKIGWSPSGRHAVLMINGHPHAVFDFDAQRGWCRSGFPPSNDRWSLDGHEWDDECLAPFRREA